jgi:hypothetical protein
MPSCRVVLAGIAAGLVLAGCATKPKEVAVAPPPPPPPKPQPMPTPPQGAVAGMTIPARLPGGSYATPNAGLTTDAALWHVRTGLNVAALGCRGANAATIVAQYNILLEQKKAALAKAYAAVLAAKGQVGYDEAMTRLYNYWAKPVVHDEFCAAAANVLARSAAVTPATIDSFATTAIAELDAPFVDFFRAYDAYRVELAQWQANRTALALQPIESKTVTGAAAASAPAPSGVPAPRIGYDPSVFTTP